MPSKSTNKALPNSCMFLAALTFLSTWSALLTESRQLAAFFPDNANKFWTVKKADFLLQDTSFNHVTSLEEGKSSITCERFHPLTCQILQGRRIMLLKLGALTSRRNGLGSQLNSLLTLASFIKEENRVLVLDQSSTTAYRYNETMGLFSGFFQTDFLVLDYADELSLVRQELEQVANHTLELDELDKHAANKTLSTPSSAASQVAYLTTKTHKSYMKHFNLVSNIRQNICPSKAYCSLDVFEERSKQFCQSYPIAPHVHPKVKQLLINNAGIQPDDLSKDMHSIAFHIRRGDKILGESRAFNADEYVTRLLEKMPAAVDAKHCFLATDAFTVQSHLQMSLHRHGIRCQLHSFAQEQHGVNRESTDDTYIFLAEMYAMTKARYFIGSFNSNVGQIVSLGRGCNQVQKKRNGRTVENRYHSYGVDSNEWFLM